MSPHILSKLKSIRTQACHDQHRLSAIILRKGILISSGFNNQTKTHPAIKKYNEHQTIHAEFSACMKVKNKKLLNGATMIIYRESADGEPALARPCSSCYSFLKNMGIKNITYSTPLGFTTEKLN